MDPFETLATEHRLIEQVLQAFGNFAAEVRHGGRRDSDDLGAFVSVLREVHARHEGFEEGILFVHLVARGFPPTAGPIALLSAEHDEAGALLETLAAAAAAAGPPAPAEWHRIADQIRAYVELLRRHILKEEMCLFPAAREHLPDAAIARLRAQLAAAPAVGLEGALQARVDELVGRYGSPAHRPGAAATTRVPVIASTPPAVESAGGTREGLP